MITQEELQERDYSNLYQAISSLRPGWMRARGQDSVRRPPPIQVYLGNTQLGGVDALRNFGVGEVAYVRYFDPNQAMAHFGVGHDQGVIYLSVSPDG